MKCAVIFFQEINKSGSAVCVSSIPLVRRGLSSHIYHISFFVEQVLVIASGLIYDHLKLQSTGYWVFDYRKIWYIVPN